MILRRVARPLLATIFVSEGIESLRDPGSRVEAAEPVIDLVAEAARPGAQKLAAATSDAVESATTAVDERVEIAVGTSSRSKATGAPSDGGGADGPTGTDAASVADHVHEATSTVRTEVQAVARGGPLPFGAETYVRVNAAVQLGAGILLASGRLPRLSSAALAATLVPTTLAHHRFWEAEGEERRVQRVQFQKNLSLVGGLLLAAADTEGRPGLRWRADHAGDQARIVAGDQATRRWPGERFGPTSGRRAASPAPTRPGRQARRRGGRARCAPPPSTLPGLPGRPPPTRRVPSPRREPTRSSAWPPTPPTVSRSAPEPAVRSLSP